MTSSEFPSVEALFRELLPTDCAVIAAPLSTPAPPLLSEEMEATRNMVEKRRTEFAVGRDCARRALKSLGCDTEVVIPVGDGRAPTWPLGYIGSITHSSGMAAAAATWRRHHQGLGIDMEPDAPLEPELSRRICLPAETSQLTTLHPGVRNGGRLLFSMKESAYKCLWPITRQFLDFHELELSLEPDGNSFRARIHGYIALEPTVRRLQGRWALGNGWMVSAAWLDRG